MIQVTRLADAQPYDAPRHHGMSTLRLHGADVSPASTFTVGLSVTLPSGGAESGSSPYERVYVVLSGQLTVTSSEGESVLSELDSVLIPPGEVRSLENRSNLPTVFLVVMSQVKGDG